jgi:hypothetical protein
MDGTERMLVKKERDMGGFVPAISLRFFGAGCGCAGHYEILGNEVHDSGTVVGRHTHSGVFAQKDIIGNRQIAVLILHQFAGESFENGPIDNTNLLVTEKRLEAQPHFMVRRVVGDSDFGGRVGKLQSELGVFWGVDSSQSLAISLQSVSNIRSFGFLLFARHIRFLPNGFQKVFVRRDLR